MGGQAPLTGPWHLKTYPAPDAQPTSVRLLAYTCAGGHPAYPGDAHHFFRWRCAADCSGAPCQERRQAPIFADLYGVMLRSTPSDFVCVDHENDEGSVTVRLFDWRRGKPEAAIDTLEPYPVHTIPAREPGTRWRR